MIQPISGIHHITAIASDPQRNVDFYTRVLGLRLVKKTINFDAPDVYHFYFGDERGSPGTILTFFPFSGASKGKRGMGELTFTALSIPKESIPFWRKRLKGFGIPVSDTLQRFGEEVIRFTDPDGMGIELLAVTQDARTGWAGASVPEEHAIRGIAGATLNLRDPEPTAALLTQVLNYRFEQALPGKRFRYGIEGKPGEAIDLVVQDPPDRSIQSAGSVHHIAFRTATMEQQVEIQRHLQNQGVPVTEVKDRSYFKSIYFREPGGLLFEVATDSPGFAIDEPLESLGTRLMLPDWVAPQREQIESKLKPIRVNYQEPWTN
ncbi:glyoxalase family protein [Cyclobacterium xiamenense]|uniref:Glyoxalase family protein n=1 Tax=Cyclobacterium xiamenense TaxID=1297121 RepID=A0A1H6YC25_9BACT|nr:ring-cleaving dioxygenase [Cyclobacterium xiamenense]SEJ37434.1 glyoxalase family protein [Cyclobacterium xiamenense]